VADLTGEFTGASYEKYRGYSKLSYTWCTESCRKFCKLAFITAFEDINDLTVFTTNRNSLNHEVLSISVHCYQLLHKKSKYVMKYI